MPANPTDPVPRRLTAAAAACLAVAVVMDGGGLAGGQVQLWTVGAWLHLAAAVLAPTALVVGAARLVLPARGGAPRRLVAPLAALAVAGSLLALGRWIRGHPAVPPDPPILAAEIAALLVLLLALLPYGTTDSTRVRFMPIRKRLRR